MLWLLLACAPQNRPPEPATPPPPSPYGFAPSELTASADEITALSLSLLRGEPAPLPFLLRDDIDVSDPVRRKSAFLGLEHVDVVGFQWQVFTTTADGSAPLELGLILTADGLFLRDAQEGGPSPVPVGPALPGMDAAVSRISAEISAGRAHTLGMSHAQCAAALGSACRMKGLYGSMNPISSPEAFDGAGPTVHVMRMGPLMRQDDGRLIFGMYLFGEESGGAVLKGPHALRMESRGFHGPDPVKPTPPTDADPAAQQVWCLTEWPQLASPETAVSLRCAELLLADAYHVSLDALPGELSYDPFLLGNESWLDFSEVSAMQAHVSAACPPEPDVATICGRIPEVLSGVTSRKSSVFEDINRGDFAAPLCKILSGEPLVPADLLLQTPHQSWSVLTLQKLEAAVYVRNGFQPATPETQAFFLQDRASDEPGAVCLPVSGADGNVTALDRVDRDNLALIARAKAQPPAP